MEQQNKDNNEIEIDLLLIFKLLISKMWLIIIVGLIFMITFFGITKFTITPQYESNTTMYILAQEDKDYLTSNDMETSEYIAKDYQKIISGRKVIESVIDDLKLNMTYEDLLNCLRIESEEGTRIITIYAKSDSPAEARDIANTVRNIAIKQIQNVMNIETANVVDVANLPEEPCSPNIVKNSILGGMLGALLAIVFVLIRFLINDTIKTPDDVTKYLELSNLGTIPVNSELGSGKSKSKRKKRRR